MRRTFEYIIKNGSVTTDAKYPYRGKGGYCDEAKTTKHAAKITGYMKISPNDEAMLKAAVAKQPVSTAIDANEVVEKYTRRISPFDNFETPLNHGVTIVGYETENELDYWIVKNS